MTLLGFVAVIGLMGSIGTLIPVFADLLGHPIGHWKPVPRLLTAAAFLAVSIFAGIPVYRDAIEQRKREPDAPPATVAAIPTTTTSTTTADVQPVLVATAVSSPQPVTTTPFVPSERKEPPKPARTEVPVRRASAAVTDDAGNSIPQLLAVAQRVLPSEVVTGRVHETVEQDHALADLYTVRLTLTATIAHGDTIVSAFTLQSRGGGFQIEAARAQALDRLVKSFHERVINGQ
jgi:hypothetical protein